jgi:hypothetical protein
MDFTKLVWLLRYLVAELFSFGRPFVVRFHQFYDLEGNPQIVGQGVPRYLRWKADFTTYAVQLEYPVLEYVGVIHEEVVTDRSVDFRITLSDTMQQLVDSATQRQSPEYSPN